MHILVYASVLRVVYASLKEAKPTQRCRHQAPQTAAAAAGLPSGELEAALVALLQTADSGVQDLSELRGTQEETAE